MKIFLVALLTEDGQTKGYYDGASFNNTDPVKARYFEDKGAARSALGNLQRRDPNVDYGLIPATLSVTID